MGPFPHPPPCRREDVEEPLELSSGSPCLPCWGGHELCGQHWCKELVCDRSLRNPWTSEQTACGMQWRYGFGLCQEGKARTEEEGDACCNHPTKEDVQKKGWTVHLL